MLAFRCRPGLPETEKGNPDRVRSELTSLDVQSHGTKNRTTDDVVCENVKYKRKLHYVIHKEPYWEQSFFSNAFDNSHIPQ